MEAKVSTIKEWLGEGSINVFGMPFAGKDTQGKKLAELLGGNLLGGGDILRNSVIPQHVKEMMDAGDLVPIEDYLQIVLPYLSSEQFQGKPLILSSVGRWKGEEEGVMEAATNSGHPLKAVIELTVSESVARERHAAAQDEERGQRVDDAIDVITTRFKEFHSKTRPVLERYDELGLLIEVDGTPSEPKITQEIIEQLYLRATST
ncbi:nucleoside monophosphate kinase [Candidatus Saccharibacteria bacterium]|nr:nucleoside monophosphate kinase [Candidatus Saccharibacteria bacterium]